MRNHLLRGLILAFLLGSLLLLLWFNAAKPHILLVYSGAAASPVNLQFEQGVAEVLKSNRQPVLIERHYMETSGMDTAARRRQLQLQFEQLLSQRRPDLVALIDDESNALMGRAVLAHKGTRLLYASVNQHPTDFGYAHGPQLSGFTEDLPLTAVIEVLGVAIPGRPARLAFLASGGASGRGALERVENFNWGPHRLVSSQLVTYESQWREAVQALGGQVDVLLVGNLGSLEAGAPPSAAPVTGEAAVSADLSTLVQWTESQSQPLPIGLTATYAAYGGGLALAPSRFEEGRTLLTMALAWFDPRRDKASPAPATVGHFQVHVGRSALERRGVRLPVVLMEAARDMGTLSP